jgi:N-acetylglucosaminyl-diphospho-decaprenol L-rhamnosyltransferase
MKRATISIVSHGHADLVAALLEDLERQHEVETLRVVVTLNVPEDAPAAGRYPKLDLVIRRNETPLGFGANHNAALASASTPWLVILNPDVRLPDSGTLSKLLRPEIGSRTGLRAPVIFNSAGKREDSIRENLDPISLLVRAARRRRGSLDLTVAPPASGRFIWLAGMFLCVPTAIFQQVGGFDERFFLYCEDYDLSARIVRTGRDLEVYEDVAAIHDARRSSHTSGRYLQMHLRSLVRVWLSPTFWIIWAKDLRAAAGERVRRSR